MGPPKKTLLHFRWVVGALDFGLKLDA